MKARILHFNPNHPRSAKCQPAISQQAIELATKIERLIRIYGPRQLEGIALQIDRLEQRASG